MCQPFCQKMQGVGGQPIKDEPMAFDDVVLINKKAEIRMTMEMQKGSSDKDQVPGLLSLELHHLIPL